MNLVLRNSLVLIMSDEAFPCDVDPNVRKSILDSYYH
jgi:hypothetical protein